MVSATLTVTIEIEISGTIAPAEPDVGIMRSYAVDVSLTFLGAESGEHDLESLKDMIIQANLEEIQEALCDPELSAPDPDELRDRQQDRENGL